MTSTANSASAKAGAITCIALLALVCLAITADPPPDPLLRSFLDLVVKALRVPIQGGFALAVIGGIAILLVLVATAITQFMAGARVDPWRLLTKRIAATLAVYGFLALLASIKPRRPEPGNAEPPPAVTSPSRPAAPPPRVASKPMTTAPAFPFRETGLLLIGVAGVIGMLVWRSRRTPQPEPGSDERILFEAVRRRLETGDQIRDAIIASYAGMCDIFARRVPAGASSLTPREFSAYLRSRGVGEPEILGLTAVFEKARYSDLPCDERDRRAALEALRVIEAHHGHLGTP